MVADVLAPSKHQATSNHDTWPCDLNTATPEHLHAPESHDVITCYNLTGHKLSKQINFSDFANCDQTLLPTSVNQVTKLESVVGHNEK